MKGAGIGAGYFARFHYDGWSRIPEVEIFTRGDPTAVKRCRTSDIAGVHWPLHLVDNSKR